MVSRSESWVERNEIQLTTSAVASVDPKTKRMIFVARLLRGWLRALARGSAIPDWGLLRGVSSSGAARLMICRWHANARSPRNCWRMVRRAPLGAAHVWED